MGHLVRADSGLYFFDTEKLVFRERTAGRSRHQSPVPNTVLVGAEVVENENDKSLLLSRVRALSGKENAEVGAIRKVVDKEGRTIGYQVDIR